MPRKSSKPAKRAIPEAPEPPDATDAAEASTAQPLPASLARRHLDLLAEEGYRPVFEPDEDGRSASITFKAEGKQFVLLVDEDDETFFHLGLGFALDAGHDVQAAIATANELNERWKGVKVTVLAEHRSIRFQIESLLPGGTCPPPLLDRALQLLRGASTEFFEGRRSPAHLDA